MRVNRLIYANLILSINKNSFLIIDETGFILHTHVKHRYILTGQAAHYIVSANRKKNVSLVVIISCHKIKHF